MALLEEKCRKMLAYKYALGLSHYEPVKLDGLAERLNSPQADAVNRHLHEAMITCLSNDYDMLPIAGLSERSIAVVSPTSDTSDRFVAFCEKYADIDAYRQLPTAATAASIKKKHDVVIVAIYDDKESSRRMLQRFSDHPGTIAVFFTNPYRLRKFAHSLAKVHSVLLVGESTEPAREYAAQALFGGIAVSGRLPVNVKGIADVGDGIDLPKTRLGYAAATDEGFDVSMEARLDSLIRLGLETRAFPGCQLLVARNGNIVVDKAYGVTTRAKGGRRVTTKTIYDIASVSKALGTLPGVMKACDEGLLSLDAKASRYIEGLRNTDKKDITIKQLLYHESGLPAALDIYGLMVDTTSFTGRLLRSRPSSLYSIKVGRKAYLNNQARLRRDITSSVQSAQFPIQAASGLFVSDATMDTVRRAIYAAKLKSRIYRYSDLNFCLLMEAEEAVTHIPHDKWVAREIYEPLGAWRTLYRPLSRFSAKEIAPTERDRFLRKQVLQGYVHDETASMSGGVQGNAGLFSTAEDLAKVCQMLLNGGTYGGERLLSQQVTDEFLSSKSHKSRRGLGFDKPDLKNPDKSPTAIEATSSTIGHIGFTGTCFWVDPEHELIYVFLCNRINPTRDNRAFNELDIRPKLFSIVYQSMDR